MEESRGKRSDRFRMARRTRILLILLAAIFPLGVWAAWDLYDQYREWQFTKDLDLVGFSTSMIGGATPEAEEAAFIRATELRIDLFRAYQHCLKAGPRFSLAWLLISQESSDYLEFASKNVETVPWPEVRIWCVRCGDEKLSENTREQLTTLLLMSPTSEARLFAARWYYARGKFTQADDAYHDAMASDFFWDALDAADQLLNSERYHDDAVRHIFGVVKDSKYLTERAAYSLAIIYDRRGELTPMIEACRKEQNGGPNRAAFIAELEPLVEADLADPGTGGHVWKRRE